MSTYLVCFAVHQFDFVERFSAKGVPVSLSWFSIHPAKLHVKQIYKMFKRTDKKVKDLHHVGG